MPSAYSSIYLKVEDYRTENKTQVDMEHEWEKLAVASISISSQDEVLQ